MAPHRVPVSSSGDSTRSDSASSLPPELFRQNELIAIIGMGCRLPGGVNSSSKLWDLLAEEKTGQCKVPASRFNVDAFYHPKGVDRPGSMNTQGGYFLQEDPRSFDPGFFGISPLEATYMDPQQRKLLEVVFEAFESAGASLEDVSGCNVGCYVGNFTVDYQVMQTRDPEYLSRYSATGMGTTILGNRISHVFNLKGPSLVLDTACSSSLYCLHVACAALESGECDAAVVAGANLIQSPEQHLGTMKAGVLSGTSTCHTFSTEADGYGRAEGIGCLYLKRLSDAIRDNDPIRSVIRATAVNSNGKTPGITLPSSEGQEAVIRKCYEKAGVDFGNTAYVECHGTGTPVGDPIEVEGLSRVFGGLKGDPLLIGSVKTNLGHSEAASGIAGVMKTVLSLEHGLIPATVGVNTINPKIKSDEWNINVVREMTPWPVGCGPRRAGINSFGYGGANAHAILEAATDHSPVIGSHEPSSRKRFLIPFSAASETSLNARVQNLSQYVLDQPIDIRDLIYTLGERRTHFSHRGFMLAASDTLGEFLKVENLQTLVAPSNSPGKYAFVFNGQGAQWAEMGKALFDEFPVFTSCIKEMDTVLRNLPHPPAWSLKQALLEPKETSNINNVTQSQPTCTAIQVAIVALLASWEIFPSAVVGHSSGEIAAAFAAGHLSVAEAITAAYYRGYVVGNQTQDGAMIAVGLGREAANVEIQSADVQGRAIVACINSPESVTVSGDRDAVETLLASLNSRGIFARKLNTGGTAYHSHHMAAIGQEYEDLLSAAIQTLEPSSKMATQGYVTWISSVTSEKKSGGTDAAYWRANLQSPVLFSIAVEEITATGDFHFIEIGPHSALEMPLKQIKAKLNIDFSYSSALIRFKNEVDTILSMVGGLYLRGDKVAWENVNDLAGSPWINAKFKQKVLHDIPPYSWAYDTSLWNECRSSYEFRNRKHPRHELLGSQVPGGNGLETLWRNVVKLADINWLSDHQLEETIVFPGAGYVAMAIEGIKQVSGFSGEEKLTFKLQNVNILAALVVNPQATTEIELFTTLRPSAITSTSNSKDLWEFSIVSFEDGLSTIRATGVISCQESPAPISRKYRLEEELLENTQSRVWYQNLIRVGLNFGPAFQSIQEFWVSRMKEHNICTTKVPLLQGWKEGWEGHPEYVIHPITIDAMLQTAIIATTAGSTRVLGAKVPVSFGTIVIQNPPESFATDAWYIDSEAKVVGFGAAEINAELRTAQGEVAAQISNVKLSPYNAGLRVAEEEKRHPMLRVLWKPDAHGLGLMAAEKFSQYLEHFAAEAHSDVADEGLLKMGAALDLLSHKSPSLRILELGNTTYQITNATIDLLKGKSAFPRVLTYTSGYIADDGKVFGTKIDLEKDLQAPVEKYDEIHSQTFDIVLLPAITVTDSYLGSRLSVIKDILSPEGVLLALSPSTGPLHSAENGFEATTCYLTKGSGRVILSHPIRDYKSKLDGKSGAIVVIDRGITSLSEAVANKLSAMTGRHIARLSIDEVSAETVPLKSIIFSLLEVERPILAGCTEYEMEKIKIITDHASKLVWVTAGNMLQATEPKFGIVNGLSRALMMEQPSLTFFTFDVDNISAQPETTAQNIISVLSANEHFMDYEFVQQNGVVHVSRFVPDDNLNSSFRQKQGDEVLQISLDEAKPAQLSISEAGNFDSIHFKQFILPETLKPTDVQVSVKTVGLNAKDYYVLGGKTETKNATCTLEFCGVVERVGSEVPHLTAGDRVVVMAPGYFRTSEIVPAWTCQKLQNDEPSDVMCTLPVAYATALYALRDRAHLQRGESVLIQSGAGGVGIAAIQVAQQRGAEIYTTVSSDEKKDYLVAKFGLKRENIFTSRDGSFLPGIMDATNNRGVDVVLNSLVGDLLHASWKCCASFGRFIEIGKRDLVDCGKLEMEQFLKNATFSAFDLSNMYYHTDSAYHEKWASLLTEVLDLYRAKKIQKIEPLEVFDVTNAVQALRYFSSRNRLGKVVISLEDGKSQLAVRPQRYKTTFNPEKSFVMIGCLGGLGRSMAKWMMIRGARKFSFLGRSGTDKPSARRLIEDLERNGATCAVVRGDVCSASDVQRVVDSAEGPIGGVIQAAMGLNESLFSRMSNNSWHTGIDPKVQGTLHLHEAIKGKDEDLEFFLMTSSISGSVGTATESNYCAGNYFLDCFARYRQSQGLQATAIGLGMISEVGYLHENPEIEQLLLRKGIQAINEDELLQIIDISLSNSSKMPHAYDTFAHAHILTGLEPFGLKAMRKQGFEGTNPTLNDPRASVLARALDGENDLVMKGQTGRLPAEAQAQIEDGKTMPDAILRFIVKRFSNLVLLPLDKVDITKPLASYGMDSMIAAEFRSWFFQSLKVDIPFLELLSKTVTLNSLSKAVVTEIEQDE